MIYIDNKEINSLQLIFTLNIALMALCHRARAV